MFKIILIAFLLIFNVKAEGPSETIRDSLKGRLQAQESIVSDFDVTFDNPNLVVEQKDITNLTYDPQSQKFSAQAGSVILRGRVRLMTDIPVTNRPISTDDVISEGDITLQKFPNDRLTPQIVSDKAYLVGKVTQNRVLQPGQPIFRTDVRAPIVIKRGALVAVTYRVGSMVLNSQAEAQSDGIKGETIALKNMQTQKLIHAVAVAPNQALIEPLGAFE